MTNEQEIIAEKIIQLHKDNDSHLDWTGLYYGEGKSLLPPGLSDRKQYELLELLKSGLCDRGLIEVINTTGDKTRLKEKGVLFNGFEMQRKRLAKKEKEERFISFPQRHWWAFGLLAYFGGLATEPIRDMIFPKLKQDTTQLKPTIPTSTDSILNHKNNSSYDNFPKHTIHDTIQKGH